MTKKKPLFFHGVFWGLMALTKRDPILQAPAGSTTETAACQDRPEGQGQIGATAQKTRVPDTDSMSHPGCLRGILNSWLMKSSPYNWVGNVIYPKQPGGLFSLLICVFWGGSTYLANLKQSQSLQIKDHL